MQEQRLSLVLKFRCHQIVVKQVVIGSFEVRSLAAASAGFEPDFLVNPLGAFISFMSEKVDFVEVDGVETELEEELEGLGPKSLAPIFFIIKNDHELSIAINFRNAKEPTASDELLGFFMFDGVVMTSTGFSGVPGITDPLFFLFLGMWSRHIHEASDFNVIEVFQDFWGVS